MGGLPTQVRIREVASRDGFQGLANVVPAGPIDWQR
jgi:hypothetical protein